MEASRPKTLYLHIGSPKTGTSALQYFLLQNRCTLNQKGFHYPVHDVDTNGISSGNAVSLAKSLKEDTAQAKWLVSKIMNTELPNVILSSEYFFFLKEERIKTLKDLLSQTDAKVIAYLRRQDSMLLSVYQQKIKRGRGTVGMETWYAENYMKERYSHNQIKKWAAVFGKDNIIVRPYEQGQFAGGTIFSDFLESLPLKLTTEFILPAKRINTAYRNDALEAMRLFNTLPLINYFQLLDTLLQQFSESRGRQGDWPYDLMSPAQRIQICDYHACHNAEIAQEYLGRKDGRFFYDPLPSVDEPWKPYPGLSPQAVREITTYIDEHGKAVCRQIVDAITQGLRSEDTAVKLAAQTLSSGLEFFRRSDGTMKGGAVSGLQNGVNAARRIYYALPENMRKQITAIVKSACRRVRAFSPNEKN